MGGWKTIGPDAASMTTISINCKPWTQSALCGKVTARRLEVEYLSKTRRILNLGIEDLYLFVILNPWLRQTRVALSGCISKGKHLATDPVLLLDLFGQPRWPFSLA